VQKVELSARAEDLHEYVQARIDGSGRARRLIRGRKYESEIVDSLVDSAKEMYLYQQLMVVGSTSITHNSAASPPGAAILTWLAKACRILPAAELRIAVALEPGEFELEHQPFYPRGCLYWPRGDHEAGGTVRLVHYTVQEYLLQKRFLNSHGGDYYCRPGV